MDDGILFALSQNVENVGKCCNSRHFLSNLANCRKVLEMLENVGKSSHFCHKMLSNSTHQDVSKNLCIFTENLSIFTRKCKDLY